MTEPGTIEPDLNHRKAERSNLRSSPHRGAQPSSDEFQRRHIGPSDEERQRMLELLGFKSLDELIDAAVPARIRMTAPLQIPAARTEAGALSALKEIASQNQVFRSFIGMGYYDCITPPVIQRNVLENPGWYTQYTPYQAEISQGRLEALLNFQTMVIDLTGLEIANASLLDEATAAAEAMTMCHGLKAGAKCLLRLGRCHPQTIDVVQDARRSARRSKWSLAIIAEFQFDRAGVWRAGPISGYVRRSPRLFRLHRDKPMKRARWSRSRPIC